MHVRADFSGAIRKTKTLLNLSRAVKYVLTAWSADAVKKLKTTAQGMRRSGRKTGLLARSVGFQLKSSEKGWTTTVGTGKAVGRPEAVYARILDVGGKIKPVRRKYLTIPFKGITGVAANYPEAFCLRAKSGALLLVKKTGSRGIRPLFLLVKEVNIPAFRWFSETIESETPALREKMSETNLYKIAETLGEGT